MSDSSESQELIKDKFSALRKGLLEFLVFKIIADRPVYAADILSELQKTDFATGEGTLYPMLSRLRRDQLLDYEWVESEAGPPRKYYRLTATGEQHLEQLQTYWQHLNAVIDGL